MNRAGFRAFALVVLFAVLAVPAHAATAPMKDNLYGVKAVSSTEAWAVGNFGAIYHTADAGKTWDSHDGGTRDPLFGIDFAPRAGGGAGEGPREGPREGPGEGWIVGKASLILHTADGGKTWKPQKSAIPPDKHLFCVKAIDANTVWVVGDWGAIAVTHDGGATWENRSLGTVTIKMEETPERVTKTLSDDIILYEVSFPDPQHGYIVGEFGTLLATADGGETWEPHELPEKQRLVWMRAVSMVPGTHGFVVGAGGFAAAIDHDQVILPDNGTRAGARP